MKIIVILCVLLMAGSKTTIHFDDVVITGDDVPDMNLSVDPRAKFTNITLSFSISEPNLVLWTCSPTF